MSAISPQTDIYLVKVPLEIDNNNQLTFTNTTAQYNYFSNLPRFFVGDNNTYQRKDGTIAVEGNYDDLVNYNYVMYRNENFSNKWFYAFITGMEFTSTDVTTVSIQTDVFQTWQFDLNYKQTFIEREHVNDDTLGLHTVAENFDLGEYQINDTRHFSMVGDVEPDPQTQDPFYVCFCVTEPPEPNNPVPIVPTVGYDIGAVFTPLTFFAVRSNNGFEDAREMIEWYRSTRETLDTAIINMYMIPLSCVDTSVSQTWTYRNTQDIDVSITVYAVKRSTSFVNSNPLRQAKVTSGLYTPKNNKLYTYPYCYLYLDNKCGESVVYKWEDGQDIAGEDYSGKGFYFYTSLVPSASISGKLWPLGYKGKTESSPFFSLWNYGINFGKVPVCAWTNDYYTNWLTQNGVNVASQLVGGIGRNIAAAAFAKDPVSGSVGAGLGVASTIASTVSAFNIAETTPPQAAGDVNTGDVTFAYTFNNITAYQMTIRREVAEIIDNYWNMFGYKVNTVKLPNITGRRNWNYVKTVGCYIEADIPQDDLQEIKSLFDRGITLWHNPATFADYTQPNDII